MTDQEKCFTAKEICNIINACVNTNIEHLDVNGLLIKFSPQEVYPTVEQLPIPPLDTEQINEIMNQDEIYHDSDLEALEMENLMINDPLEYERQMERGD